MAVVDNFKDKIIDIFPPRLHLVELDIIEGG